MYYCDETTGQCKGRLKLKKGERCVINDDYGDSLKKLMASLQCEEGLGCVPIEHGRSEGTCQEITTLAEEEKECDNDNDCPLDASCECDDYKGKVQCIPIPTSSSELVEMIENYYEELFECFKNHQGIEALGCVSTETGKLYQYIGERDYYHRYEFRCANYSLLSDASVVNFSVMSLLTIIIFVCVLFMNDY